MKIFLFIKGLLGTGLAVFHTDSSRYVRWLLMSAEELAARQWIDRVQRDEPLLPDHVRVAHVPTTKRRVASIQQVPEDIRSVFLASLNPFKGIETAGLSEKERDWINRGAAQQWIIKDRKEPWGGGCSAGEHFLEAGETAQGWWILYESGGAVDVTRLIIVQRGGDTPRIVGSFPVRL